MEMIDVIQKFEKDFIEAGKLAVKLRKNAVISDKFSSGIKDIDIVTSADLAVQEFLLQKLVNSELKNCELVAEENTPSKKLFSKHSDIVLTIDPIDGTKSYATGGKFYSVIITLHNKKEPIYTFDYFPELNWGIKIVNKTCKIFGETPKVESFTLPPKTIAYSNLTGESDPQVVLPEICESLKGQNYHFKSAGEIGKAIDPRMLFILGITDGYFTKQDGSAVDCLTIFHYALSRDYKIFQSIDLSRPIKSSWGSDEYEGYYLVLREKV